MRTSQSRLPAYERGGVSDRAASASCGRSAKGTAGVIPSWERPQPSLEETHHLYTSSNKKGTISRKNTGTSQDHARSYLYANRVSESPDPKRKQALTTSRNRISDYSTNDTNKNNNLSSRDSPEKKKPILKKQILSQSSHKVLPIKLEAYLDQKAGARPITIKQRTQDTPIENLLSKLREIKDSVKEPQKMKQEPKFLNKLPESNKPKTTGLLRQTQNFTKPQLLQNRSSNLRGIPKSAEQANKPSIDTTTYRGSAQRHRKPFPADGSPEPVVLIKRMESQKILSGDHLRLKLAATPEPQPEKEKTEYSTSPYKPQVHKSSKSLRSSKELNDTQPVTLKADMSERSIQVARSVRSKLRDMVSLLEHETSPSAQKPNNSAFQSYLAEKDPYVQEKLDRLMISGLDSLDDLPNLDTRDNLLPSHMAGLQTELSLPTPSPNELQAKVFPTRTPPQNFKKRHHKHSHSMHSDKKSAMMLLSDPAYLLTRLTDKIAHELQTLESLYPEAGFASNRPSTGVARQQAARKLVEQMNLHHELIRPFPKPWCGAVYYVAGLHREYSASGRGRVADSNGESENSTGQKTQKHFEFHDACLAAPLATTGGGYVAHFANNIQGLLAVIWCLKTKKPEISPDKLLVKDIHLHKRETSLDQKVILEQKRVGDLLGESERQTTVKKSIGLPEKRTKHKKSGSTVNKWTQIKSLVEFSPSMTSFSQQTKNSSSKSKLASSKTIPSDMEITLILDKDSLYPDIGKAADQEFKDLLEFLNKVSKDGSFKIFSVDSESMSPAPSPRKLNRTQIGQQPSKPKSKWDFCFPPGNLVKGERFASRVGSKQLVTLSLDKVCSEHDLILGRTVLLSSRFYWAGQNYHNLIPILEWKPGPSSSNREFGVLFQFLKYLGTHPGDLRPLLDIYFGWDIVAHSTDGLHLERQFAERFGILVSRKF